MNMKNLIKNTFEFTTELGFDADEDVALLGTALKLPKQYEHKRQAHGLNWMYKE